MAWIAVNKNRVAFIHEKKPIRVDNDWICQSSSDCTTLSPMAMRILIGRKLTWDDEPVELKEVHQCV